MASMPIRFFILFFFLVEQFFPLSRAWAALPRGIKSVVVWETEDGIEDEASRKTADILRQRLSTETPLHVIDPKKVREVLAYYKDYQHSPKDVQIEEAKSLLARGKEHYYHFAFVEAGAELKKSIRIFESNPHFTPSAGQTLVDSWIMLALVHAATREKEKAVENFQKVLALAPFYKLDEKGFAPSVRKLFQKAREKLPDLPPGEIRIKSDPKVAEIYLNGIYQGISPMVLSELPSGNYFLSVRANHYQSNEGNVSLQPGEKIMFRPKLSWRGPNPPKSGQTPNESFSQIEEGLRIAKLLKADKVIWVDVDPGWITCRMVDRKYRTSHKPIVIPLNTKTVDWEENFKHLVPLLLAQTELDLTNRPLADFDVEGNTDPILLGKRRRKIPKGVVFGGLGALSVGGVVIGLLAAGGSKSPNTGEIFLSFK